MWKLSFNHSEWESSICSCPQWNKCGICEHLVGVAVQQNLLQPPANVNPAKLRKPTKRMPRQNAVKALTRQPNYDRGEPSQPSPNAESVPPQWPKPLEPSQPLPNAESVPPQLLEPLEPSPLTVEISPRREKFKSRRPVRRVVRRSKSATRIVSKHADKNCVERDISKVNTKHNKYVYCLIYFR